MPRHGHQAQLGRMLELPVARPLPIQILAIGRDELDDLADRHGLAQRIVSGTSIHLQRCSLPVTLQGVFHLRRLTPNPNTVELAVTYCRGGDCEFVPPLRMGDTGGFLGEAIPQTSAGRSPPLPPFARG